MACTTCDHTMHRIEGNGGQFWCPRCGTLKLGDNAERPMLVERCRRYQAEFDKENIAQFYRNEWARLGIAEAIHTPENRNADLRKENAT